MKQTTKAPLPPCILGIVTADMLAHNRYPDALWRCGGVELRADGLPPEKIAGAVADFDAEKGRRGFTGPVIFTLRLRRDGGAWADADSQARNAVWESLPPGTCDWVDLEIEEIDRVSPESLDSLRSSGVRILLSHHAFDQEEPTIWGEKLSSMHTFGPDGVKFAVAIVGEGEKSQKRTIELLRLARIVAERYPVSCVIGMGDAGKLTRLIAPLLGCPFTYGFLDHVPKAPGQLPAEDMRTFFAFAEKEGVPGQNVSDEDWLKWAGTLWNKVARVY